MIKVSDLAAKVREIGEAHPDATYKGQFAAITGEQYLILISCKYQVDKVPACIVGIALSELGVSTDQLEMFDADQTTIEVTIEEYPDIFDVDDVNDAAFVAAVQDAQDRQETWGEAIAQ